MKTKTTALIVMLALSSISFVVPPAAADCTNYGNQINVGTGYACSPPLVENSLCLAGGRGVNVTLHGGIGPDLLPSLSGGWSSGSC